MTLPFFKNLDQAMQLLQTAWASILNPVINNPLVLGTILKGVFLDSGTNIVNHKLGRKLQGWIVVSQDEESNFWDSQATNAMADKTLVLNSTDPVTVNLYVF